jgi:DNA-binding response OmpR family regulator
MKTPSNKMIKILVVEDSRTQADYLRHILEVEGYRVTLAENGMEALDQISLDRPSIILADIIMPKMDGYELSYRIKKDPATAAIPVILVSQLFDPVDVIRGLESGADDFIIKPYDPEYIQLRIRAILEAIRTPDKETTATPMEITIANKTHHITAGRSRILRILLSTYEMAVKKNVELEEAREQLNAVNEQLEQALADFKQSNASLKVENGARKTAEKALDEANKKLNLMASITRHDVINQLTSQHEFLEHALTLRNSDPQNAWEHVTSATTIATRALSSMKFTGDYQKIGVKSPQWQDVRTLVQIAAKDNLPNGLKFSNEIPEGMEIFADPLIEKVFSNLIENSVKYGGKITSIRISRQTVGSDTIIVFEDDGIGIPLERKEKIFSYEQGMNTGLGLFLARQILAITGISICETGADRTGAHFEINCPSATIRNTVQSTP